MDIIITPALCIKQESEMDEIVFHLITIFEIF